MKITEGQMDFLGLLSEYTDDQGATVRVREPGRKTIKTTQRLPEPEQLSFDFSVSDIIKEEPPKTEPPREKAPKKEPPKKEPPKKEPPKKEPPKAEFAKPEPVEEKVETENDVPTETEKEEKQQLFKQCKRCWCFDCKHNSRNEGIPREMCGANIPCPACDGCVEEDMATICEIGNAKEGCRLRAREEGITPDEEI